MKKLSEVEFSAEAVWRMPEVTHDFLGAVVQAFEPFRVMKAYFAETDFRYEFRKSNPVSRTITVLLFGYSFGNREARYCDIRQAFSDGRYQAPVPIGVESNETIKITDEKWALIIVEVEVEPEVHIDFGNGQYKSPME